MEKRLNGIPLLSEGDRKLFKELIDTLDGGVFILGEEPKGNIFITHLAGSQNREVITLSISQLLEGATINYKFLLAKFSTPTHKVFFNAKIDNVEISFCPDVGDKEKFAKIIETFWQKFGNFGRGPHFSDDIYPQR